MSIVDVTDVDAVDAAEVIIREARRRQRRRRWLTLAVMLAVAVVVATLVLDGDGSPVQPRPTAAPEGPVEAPVVAPAPQLVIHQTITIEVEPGFRMESWTDPETGTYRRRTYDRAGDLLQEQGWTPVTGNWRIDSPTHTVSFPVSGPGYPWALLAVNSAATYATIEQKLADGTAVDEGYETYDGVNARRVREVLGPGDVLTRWLDTEHRRVVGVKTTYGLAATTQWLDGDAAAQAPLEMPDITGYERVDPHHQCDATPLPDCVE